MTHATDVQSEPEADAAVLGRLRAALVILRCRSDVNPAELLEAVVWPQDERLNDPAAPPRSRTP